jgi:plastocyanin
MHTRRALGLAAAAAMGAAVVVLPAIASSETAPTVEAYNSGIYSHRWKPEAVTVGERATVNVANPSKEVPHGVEWKSGPETPSCSKTVPVGTSPANAGKEWSGSCTFNKQGTYVFWCTVHGEEMKEIVTVQPATTTGTTGTTATTGTTPGGTTGTSPGGGGGGGTNTSPIGLLPAAPLALTASEVRIRQTQRGHVVHGAVNVPAAGAGGSLEVVALAKRAALASARSALARVGRTVRSSVAPGSVSFALGVSARARRALARAHRLALVLRITLTPPTGAAAVVWQRVTLHA